MIPVGMLLDHFNECDPYSLIFTPELCMIPLPKLNRQNKDSHLFQKKIMHNEQKWVEVKNIITALVCTSTFTISKKGLKALADTVTSSRRTLTLTNVLADETNNPPIDDTTNNSPTDDTTNPLADDTIDDNDGFLFPD
ncbi:hypothetical protein G6F43_012449 [Rhizopus delemar]|nr:hypothetical protein G6F43_012449 [Rhizopus delemar]